MNLKTVKIIPFLSAVLKIAAVLLFSFSCDKSDPTDDTGNQTDNIYYTDIVPDTSVTSIRGWTYNSTPIPADSTAIILLDADGDKVMDTQISVFTSYHFYSASNPWANYSYGTSLGMLRDTDSVAYSSKVNFCRIAEAFAFDSVIFQRSKWSRGVITYATGSWSWPCYGDAFSSDTYFGFRMLREGGFIYGWILMKFDEGPNKVTVKEFAVNLTPNRPIKAGQKK